MDENRILGSIIKKEIWRYVLPETVSYYRT